MTVKNYKIIGGFSHWVHTASKYDIYEVKALMGTGLGLTPEGPHVAFIGGTGSLVFVDLVALIIRINLGLLDPEQVPLFAKGSKFKFILFASFPSREDACALELLEAARDITKMKGCDNFEAVPLTIRMTKRRIGAIWNKSTPEHIFDRHSKEK